MRADVEHYANWLLIPDPVATIEGVTEVHRVAADRQTFDCGYGPVQRLPDHIGDVDFNHFHHGDSCSFDVPILPVEVRCHRW